LGHKGTKPTTSGGRCKIFLQTGRQADRQTETQTDTQTDTDKTKSELEVIQPNDL